MPVENEEALTQCIAELLQQNRHDFCVISRGSLYKIMHDHQETHQLQSQLLCNRLCCELYIHLVNFGQNIEGPPIVGGPQYHTSGISNILESILQPIVLERDYDIANCTERTVGDDDLFGTCDIKSLYTKISRYLTKGPLTTGLQSCFLSELYILGSFRNLYD